MTVHEDSPQLRETIAQACRLLAAKHLVEGILGHVSARVSDTEIVVRCRGEQEGGLRSSSKDDVWRVTMDGGLVDLPQGYSPPNELPIHTEVLRTRPEFGAVVHAHPRAALICGLAGIDPRPVFGAYNIPALRLALAGIPVFPRSVLVTNRELASEMVQTMDGADACLMTGHGITVAAKTVESATILAINLNILLEVTWELAQLGAHPPELQERDLAELPDLGSTFNDKMTWQALVAEFDEARSPRH